MAFWKKSEDPWDIDPEKRKRQAAKQAARQEGAAAEEDTADSGLLTEVAELFKKKPEPIEMLPDMVCPWCGRDMTKGYLIGGRDMIRWSAEKPGVLFGSAFLNTVDIRNEGALANYKTSWYCDSCRRVVVDVPKQEQKTAVFAWDGNPPSPADEEEETTN